MVLESELPERTIDPDTEPSLEDVRSTITACRDALEVWRRRKTRERIGLVRRARRVFADRLEALADVASASLGSRARALASEVIPLLDACRFLERDAARLLAPRRMGRRGRPAWLAGVDLTIHREPHGVVLIAGPSNYPLFLVAVQTLQALVAGNAVILKPGAGGTPAALVLREALIEAGLHADLLALLPEPPESVHRAIEASVDKVVLTGSAGAGREVLSRLAPRIVPATMELSGCDAVFVRPGADLDLVARAVRFGVTINAGSTCIAPRRIFVSSDAARTLQENLTREFATVEPVGVPAERVSRLDQLLLDALSRGASVQTSREIRADLFTPVLVTGARPDMRLFRSDVGLPVVSLITVDGDDEVIAENENCPYALGASVFGPRRDAERFASRLRAGVVIINDLIVPTADPRLPFGGRGASGFGSTRGAEGLLEMTVPKAVSIRRRGPWRHLEDEHPGDERLFSAYAVFAYGGGFVRRVRALAHLVSSLFARRKTTYTSSQEVSR